ncbi:MAG: DUF86 domain-containing protein [Candidatus Cloacimonetes bacterium]|nr:DUF86 domain-containing protein [Candidatus Cloacimonadota bacterium]
MPKREISLYIVDIFIANEKIKRYISEFSNSKDLLCNEIHWDATMRELQIIGDATSILINNNFLTDKCRLIVDFRNLITHAYFGIDAEMIWNIIHNELPEFIIDILNTIDSKKINIIPAIEFSIKEQQKLSNNLNIKFLNSLRKKYELQF